MYDYEIGIVTRSVFYRFDDCVVFYRFDDCVDLPSAFDNQIFHLSPFDDDNDEHVFHWAGADMHAMHRNGNGGLVAHQHNHRGDAKRWQMKDSGIALPQ